MPARRLFSAALLAGWVLTAPHLVSARPSKGVVHRVKSATETYEQIADHYYGKRALGHHLRVLNRQPEPLALGRSIIIPTCRQEPLGRGQSLADFAKVHLSRPGRGEYLEALHYLKSKSPSPGKLLKVPTSLRHLVRPGESLASLARTYYKDTSPHRIELLRLFNELPSDKVRVGDVVRIPLDTPPFEHESVLRRSKLPFGEAPSPSVAEATPAVRPAAAPPKRPAVASGLSPEEAQAEVEVAEQLYGDGRYAQCLRYAKQALEKHDTKMPRAPQLELLRLAAASLVALDRVAEAEATFVQLKKLDPGYGLDLYQTSPKVLDVFDSAR